MTDIIENSDRSNAVALIREAFDRARRTGKAEWQRMTTAVLKNRLLQITDNAFSIEAYGAETVVDFVNLFPEVVRVETNPTGGPSVVTLIDAEAATPTTTPTMQTAVQSATNQQRPRSQIRPDLWRATMDWNEAHVYVIDPVTGRARQRIHADPSDLAIVDGIKKAEYLRWRLEFIDRALAEATDENDRATLIGWRESPGPSRDLPTHLQDQWMTTLRANVEAHIRRWFESAGLPVPGDLTGEKVSSAHRPSVSTTVEVAVATQKLRDIVRRCVDAMSYEELQALQLPASVVARTLAR